MLCRLDGSRIEFQPDPDFPIRWEFDARTIEPAEHPTSSGERAPARTDHPQTSPAVLEVSPFLFMERTAFVGRESERSTFRAVIDRALTGHGSVVMLAGGPGVGKSRLARGMGGDASRLGLRYNVRDCVAKDAQ